MHFRAIRRLQPPATTGAGTATSGAILSSPPRIGEILTAGGDRYSGREAGAEKAFADGMYSPHLSISNGNRRLNAWEHSVKRPSPMSTAPISVVRIESVTRNDGHSVVQVRFGNSMRPGTVFDLDGTTFAAEAPNGFVSLSGRGQYFLEHLHGFSMIEGATTVSHQRAPGSNPLPNLGAR